MDCSEVTGSWSTEHFGHIPDYPVRPPDLSQGQPESQPYMWDCRGNAGGQTIGHQGYIRLHKQRREGVVDLLPGPVVAQRLQRPQNMQGQVVGFKAQTKKHEKEPQF